MVPNQKCLIDKKPETYLFILCFCDLYYACNYIAILWPPHLPTWSQCFVLSMYFCLHFSCDQFPTRCMWLCQGVSHVTSALGWPVDLVRYSTRRVHGADWTSYGGPPGCEINGQKYHRVIPFVWGISLWYSVLTRGPSNEWQHKWEHRECVNNHLWSFPCTFA